MISVKIKKGWRFKIAGKPYHKLVHAPPGSRLAAVPSIIPYIKPRLLVKTGDAVRIGSALYEDKKHPGMPFLSPGGGIVADIIYGPRRVITKIIIQLDHDEAVTSFDKISEAQLDEVDRNALISCLMNGGMWPFIRQLPFRAIADPQSTPNAVWVLLGSSDPFQPFPGVYLKDQIHFFEFGVKALHKLCDTVNICLYDDLGDNNPAVDSLVTHRVYGKYPASDPGVVVFHTKKSAAENQDWYIDGQDVIRIGKLLKTGEYPVDRIVTVSGGGSENTCHFKTRMGVRLNDLISSQTANFPQKWVAGGILNGYVIEAEGYLGLYQASVMGIDEARESELFGFLRPGIKKLSHSRTVVSALSSKSLAVNADMHGERRPCINCGYCADICPVNIMPQFTYKSIHADEIEEALAFGLLDCVECGLCTFVCPSKIELSATFIDARRRYHKELTQVD